MPFAALILMGYGALVVAASRNDIAPDPTRAPAQTPPADEDDEVVGLDDRELACEHDDYTRLFD